MDGECTCSLRERVCYLALLFNKLCHSLCQRVCFAFYFWYGKFSILVNFEALYDGISLLVLLYGFGCTNLFPLADSFMEIGGENDDAEA